MKVRNLDNRVNTKTLYLFGAGHGAVEIIEGLNAIYLDKTKIICLVDEEHIPDIPKLEVMGREYDIKSTSTAVELDAAFLNTVMDCDFKEHIHKTQPATKLNWIRFVGDHCIGLGQVGMGSILMPYSFVGSTAKVGKFVKLNHRATMLLNTEIGDYSFLGTGSQLLANAKVGTKTLVYSSVTVLPDVTIGDNTVIGAGSVVTKDIPDNVVAYGNPCKVVRRN